MDADINLYKDIDTMDPGFFSKKWSRMMNTSEEIISSSQDPILPQVSDNFLQDNQGIVINDQFFPGEELQKQFEDEQSADNAPYYVQDPMVVVTQNLMSHIPASLPANQSWPGDYNFNIKFDNNMNQKKITWTYSEDLNKLYVEKEKAFPVKFCTDSVVPNGAVVRAMVQFSSLEYSSKTVERCIDHSSKEYVPEAKHFVRCDSPLAQYDQDELNRYYVIVPFEKPPVGQDYSTYIFKCKCANSCPNLNRKALFLVFSLEISGIPVGRKTLDLKVCSCPSRDKKTDEEKASMSKVEFKLVKQKRKIESLPGPSNVFESKKIKVEQVDENGCYTIRNIKSRECFEFLTEMKACYELKEQFKDIPGVQKALQQLLKQKSVVYQDT